MYKLLPSQTVDPLTDFLRCFLDPLTVAGPTLAPEEEDALDEEALESSLAAPLPLPGGRGALLLLFLLVAWPCTGVTMYLSLRISFRRFTSQLTVSCK